MIEMVTQLRAVAHRDAREYAERDRATRTRIVISDAQDVP